MPDTGAPWNIPYADPTDLVRDWPDLSEDVADAVAAGLSSAGGLVEVKSAIFTGVQSASTASGANFAVTDLTITHACANAANKLIISAFFGLAAQIDGSGQGAVALAVHDGTGLIAIGNADGSRTRVTSGNRVSQATSQGFTMPSVTFVHVPGDTDSRTYTVRAINVNSNTRTLFINRAETDTDNAYQARAASGFVIQEVKV